MSNSNSQFFESIKSGDIEYVKNAIAETPELTNAKDENGVSAVMTGLYNGQSGMSDFLVEQGAVLNFFEASALNKVAQVEQSLKDNETLINEYTPDGFSALGLACFFGATDVIKSLLKAGANPDSSSKNLMKVSPIHSAAANRAPAMALELCTILIDHGADINVAQHQGWTPLQQAAMHGQADVVKLLLANGADKTAEADDGSTASSLAESQGFDEIVGLLND